MTLEEAYGFGKRTLEEHKIADASIDAWILLEYITKISRAMYYANPKREMTGEQKTQYKYFVEERAKRISLQHLTKEQEFMGLSFEVNEHVLIPRQDTEVLVETVLEDLEENMRVLDICTGSGCILISLLKIMRGVKGVGVDISEEALEVARRNAQKHDMEAVFIQSDLFENVEVKLHDPMLALDGKEDGLYFYRKIIKESRKYLKRNGKLYFEIGNTQGEEVKTLMEEEGFTNVKIKKDLAGLDRVVCGV